VRVKDKLARKRSAKGQGKRKGEVAEESGGELSELSVDEDVDEADEK